MVLGQKVRFHTKEWVEKFLPGYLNTSKLTPILESLWDKEVVVTYLHLNEDGQTFFTCSELEFYFVTDSLVEDSPVIGNEVISLNNYQEKALETAQYPEEYKIIYPSLG